MNRLFFINFDVNIIKLNGTDIFKSIWDREGMKILFIRSLESFLLRNFRENRCTIIVILNFVYKSKTILIFYSNAFIFRQKCIFSVAKSITIKHYFIHYSKHYKLTSNHYKFTSCSLFFRIIFRTCRFPPFGSPRCKITNTATTKWMRLQHHVGQCWLTK